MEMMKKMSMVLKNSNLLSNNKRKSRIPAGNKNNNLQFSNSKSWKSLYTMTPLKRSNFHSTL